ncbi:MAG: tetratricopeptide repeat protein [Cyanobacteria bacterium P01_F01_bin.86]
MKFHKILLSSFLIFISTSIFFPEHSISQTNLSAEEKLEIQSLVESEVNQSIGAIRWSITFVLAVLGFTPIFVGIFVLLLRGGIIRQLVLVSQGQLNEFMKTEINGKFDIELERQKNELSHKSEELFMSIKERFKNLELRTKSRQDDLLEDMADYFKRLQAIAASEKDPILHEEIRSKFLSISDTKSSEISSSSEVSSLEIYSHSDCITQGLIAHIAGNYSIAISFFEYAIKLDPDSSKAWTAKGDSLYRLGDLTEAISAYKKAIKNNPNDFEAWTFMGNPYTRMGSYEEAIEAFKKAISIESSYPYSWYYLARCYAVRAAQDEFDLMIESLRKAISLNRICSDMADKDSEFDQYRGMAEFQQLLN